MDKIKVILVDDHAVVRAGFRMLLLAHESIDVIAEAQRGEQVLHLYQELHPDIIVMDLSMPGLGGLETIRRIRLRDDTAKILVFSVHNEQVFVQRALDSGAKAYISKNSAPEILPEAIQRVAAGEFYIEQGLLKTPLGEVSQRQFQNNIDDLSPREFDIFLLLAKGLTVHKIAEQLSISYKTVANYSTAIKKKLQVNSLAELPHIALTLELMQK